MGSGWKATIFALFVAGWLAEGSTGWFWFCVVIFWPIAYIGFEEGAKKRKPAEQKASPAARPMAISCSNCGMKCVLDAQAAGYCAGCGADLAECDVDLLVYGDIAADDDFDGRFGRLG